MWNWFPDTCHLFMWTPCSLLFSCTPQLDDFSKVPRFCLHMFPMLFCTSLSGPHYMSEARPAGPKLWMHWLGGLPNPGSGRLACRRSSQWKVPEVKGPCSNHDTICWREGYTSTTLMSLSSAPVTLVILCMSLSLAHSLTRSLAL